MRFGGDGVECREPARVGRGYNVTSGISSTEASRTSVSQGCTNGLRCRCQPRCMIWPYIAPRVLPHCGRLGGEPAPVGDSDGALDLA